MRVERGEATGGMQTAEKQRSDTDHREDRAM